MTEKTKQVTKDLRDKLVEIIKNPKGIDNKNTFGLRSLLINEILIHEKKAKDYDPKNDDSEEEFLDSKHNRYIALDNLKRYFLINMLRTKSYLKGLTIEELEGLSHGVIVFLSNLEHKFERGELVIKVKDKSNWDGDSFFKNIILHSVLDIKTKDGCCTYAGEEEFKEMLKERWTKSREEIIKNLKEGK